ncbi:hypothetical protein E8E13_010161 [Curvularia kusanoi]|uniref:Uncharacterized protein n=1 Tax=Curvularia kusanoi TaxID=90978 RepID=A0A9P4TKC5_CURKU|nr:hypothetical protein E8E13_010161 [Curvularia kusanoi]
MKRQDSSGGYRNILHFFKSVPRTSHSDSPADNSADNGSPPPSSAGASQPTSTQASAAGKTRMSESTTSAVEDAPVTSIETPLLVASQTSANSGASKRVLSHGKQVVLNSDSDSDSMGELDFGVPAPKPTVPTHTGRPTRSRIAVEEPELRRPSKSARSSGKRSVNKLMETAQKNIETERKIQESTEVLERSRADLTRIHEQPPSASVTLDKNALKHAIQDDDDSDGADRLYKAVQRTNEAQPQAVYHFFDHATDLSLIPPFPHQSLPDHGWTASFEEASARDHAFMSGFAQQIFRMHELPSELATWMIDQIYLSRDSTLDQKYIDILLMHDEQLQKQLSPRKLDLMFKSIGAHVAVLENDAEISPSEAEGTHEQPLPPSLRRIAALLTCAAPWLHTKARIRAFYLLCHACLDQRILLDQDTLESVQNAMEAIICQYDDNRKLTSGVGSPPMDEIPSLITSQLTYVIPKLLSRIRNPLLQINLIDAFPTRSPLTAYLQRHLALSFLLHPDSVNLPLADPRLPALIHRNLETSSNWHMNKDTNYSFVAARIALLDVAIGPGPLTVPYLPLTSPPSSERGSLSPSVPTPASPVLREFNEEVDALAQHIKLLGNSINETGAALDLTILKAKERCERVFWRLQHAVRIGGKKEENVFGNSEDAKQLKVRRFFNPLPKKSAPGKSIFGPDGDAESST